MWKFHSSIACGIDQEEIFKNYHEDIEKNEKSVTVEVNRIAMFYCPDDKLDFISENFISYKIHKLGN